MSLLKRYKVTVSKLHKGAYTSGPSSGKRFATEIKVLHDLKPYNLHTHIYHRNNKLLSNLYFKKKTDHHLILQIVYLQMYLLDAGGILRHIRDNSTSTDKFLLWLKAGPWVPTVIQQ